MAIQPPGSYVKANKKGGDKKSTKIDTYARKEWFDLKVPSISPNNVCGKTMVTKLSNKQNLAPSLIGRRFIVNHGDLSGSQDFSFRNFVFKIYEVKGKDCIGIFDGMKITSDKHKSIVRKGHTLIEAVRDVEAADGSIFRITMIGTTRSKPNETKKTCYCKSSEEKAIRKIMFDVIDEELKGVDVHKIVKKLAAETVGKEAEKKASEVFPMQNAMVVKVKTIKSREFEDLKFARYSDNNEKPLKVE